jgi:hypothetical protein
MKPPCVRFTVRRMMFAVTICAATFGGFTHPVMAESIGIDPGRPPVEKKARAGDPDVARRAAIKQFYPKWVGVPAPELGQEGRAHDGKPVTLSAFRGRRVLLFGFDAGDFHRPPDEKALLANLRALDKAIQKVGRENLAVVGFTQGMQFIWPRAPKAPGELGKQSDFPVVSAIPTALRKFNEPYHLLLEPGAILIDFRWHRQRRVGGPRRGRGKDPDRRLERRGRPCDFFRRRPQALEPFAARKYLVGRGDRRDWRTSRARDLQ